MKEKIYYFQEKSNDILDLQDDFTAEEIGMLFILKAAYFKYSGELKEENLCQRCKFFGDKEKLILLTKKIFCLVDGVLTNQKWLEEISGIKERSEKRANAANTRWGKTRKPKKTQSEPKKTQSVFIKPTLQEVQSYCQERRNSVNPEKWLNHYESNGWKVGKNPMKDWKAAVRTWENSEFSNPEQKPTDSLATQINQIIGQDLISKVYEITRDDEKVTEVKFNTMHDRDKWLKLSEETRQKAKEIILAKFKNQKMRMA